MTAKYLLAPNNASFSDAWSVGTEPYNNNDVWTHIQTPSEWGADLCKTCEYVYVFKTNDTFNDTYGELFENADFEVSCNTLYRIIKSQTSVQLIPID